MLLFSATGTYGPGFCWAVHNDFFCQNWWVVIGGGRCLGKIVGGHPNLVCCQSNAWVHEGDNFETMTRGVLLFALRRIANFCTHVSIARDYQKRRETEPCSLLKVCHLYLPFTNSERFSVASLIFFMSSPCCFCNSVRSSTSASSERIVDAWSLRTFENKSKTISEVNSSSFKAEILSIMAASCPSSEKHSLAYLTCWSKLALSIVSVDSKWNNLFLSRRSWSKANANDSARFPVLLDTVAWNGPLEARPNGFT